MNRKIDKLKEKRLFLLDMDGTIYLDNELFDGTLDFLKYIKEIGGRYLFLTNNSSKSVTSYIEKLNSLGIDAGTDDFLTSVDATKAHIGGKYKKIYVLGTQSLKEDLKASGFPVTDKREEGIDCLLTGFDTELSFQKLEDACILLRENIEYIATNPDYVCPTWYGYVPDCGSVADILYNATKKRPYFIGKPRPDMVYLAMDKTGFSNEETVIIGDRIYTDIACGVNAGIDSIMVLSGEATMSEVENSDIKPAYIFRDIKEIYTTLKQERDACND